MLRARLTKVERAVRAWRLRAPADDGLDAVALLNDPEGGRLAAELLERVTCLPVTFAEAAEDPEVRRLSGELQRRIERASGRGRALRLGVPRGRDDPDW